MLYHPPISLFPNPTSNIITLNFSGVIQGSVLVKILDLSGKEFPFLTKTIDVSQSENVLDFQVGSLPPDMYIMELCSDRVYHSAFVVN